MLNISLPNPGNRSMVWDSRWPIVPGIYWFYGFPWGKEWAAKSNSSPDLMCVQVVNVGNSILYVTQGMTMEHKAEGVWSPVVLPDKPTEKNTTDNGKEFRA